MMVIPNIKKEMPIKVSHTPLFDVTFPQQSTKPSRFKK
jgi:hypothetical protein